MNDNYINFEFEIQFLHICHGSNDDSICTVSLYKIYSNIINKVDENKLEFSNVIYNFFPKRYY